MMPRRVELPLLGCVLALSLFLRLYGLDVFLSGDETKWVCRGVNFHAALARGDLRGTYQTGHPGVLTMWIGALAVPLSRAGDWVGLCARTGGSDLHLLEDHTQLAALPPMIFQARRWMALATWLGIMGLWWLSRRLFDEATALLGAAFIGLDPFHLALSRVLHVDALLATFMSLSVLSLLVYLRTGHAKRYLALSAVAAGLAMANKSPGGFLAPWTGLLLLYSAWPGEVSQRCERIWNALKLGILWGLIALSVVVLLWPALWVDPLDALGQVWAEALNYAGRPHALSNFFWGQVRPDPGPAFYPVAWAFRTTPWVMLGLLLLVLRGRSRGISPQTSKVTAEAQRGPEPQGSAIGGNPPEVLLVLGAFALLYAAFMMAGAKKFDRYLLPIFPFVDLLAAGGWAGLLCPWPARAGPPRRWRPFTLLALTLVTAQFALLWPARPYYFSYYNPLLGGGRAAWRVLLVGWGEGLEKAAAYLNAKPGAEHFAVGTEHVAQFAPFFRGRVHLAKRLSATYADYYVLYVNTLQRWRVPALLGWAHGCEAPDKVISANGIDYVWIYGNVPLRRALAYMDARGDPATDSILLDVPSAAIRQYTGPLPMVILEGANEERALRTLAKVTVGRRRIWYLTFPDAPSRAQGAIRRHLEALASSVERTSFDDVVVEAFDLRTDAHLALPAPTVRCDVRLGDPIRLLGYDLPTRELSRERPLSLTLYWRVTARVDTSYTVFIHLLGPDGQIQGQGDGIPLEGARPTTTWRPEEVIMDFHEISLDEAAPAGEYTLALGLYDLRTMERLPMTDASGRHLPDDCLVIEGLRLIESIH